MNIINYSKEYDESIKDLLVELQEYISMIDKEKYNILTDDYREKNFKETMNEVTENEGKIFLAIEDKKLIGIIIGIINNYEVNTYDFKAPKRGRITELIVSKECRSKGVGKQLLSEMEKHFKNQGCQGIMIEVFGYNENAQRFYYKSGYFNRTVEVMKNINY